MDVVIHAAALKRVDNDSDEAIEMKKTNIDGTQNVLEAATACGVQRVRFVSSDKSVAAENAYGKSKAMAEEIAVAYNSIAYPKNTRISAVRYGNVLWSTGSVLCKWTEAKAAGRPFNITDLNMTRFLLTAEQAVDFILLALNSMMGGEIFIPKLPAARIGDLSAALDSTWPIALIGLRPGGEKMAERLIGVEEMSRTVEQPGSYVVLPSCRGWSAIPYHGKPIAPAWIYASHTVHMLTVDEIRKMLATC
jgi:UDP-N-acetylglucosamine 4,6-dehydratase